MKTPFRQKLVESMRACGHRLCLGIDPPASRQAVEELPFFANEWDINSTTFVDRFCQAAIAASHKRVASVKFQSAFFEAMGQDHLLKTHLLNAHEKGLLTILDAKRGDISTSMTAYGQFAYEHMKADALTINTYMGNDVLQALLPWLENGKGAYLVWMTSNPSAQAIQNAKLASGETVADLIFSQANQFAQDYNVKDALGFVLGATRFHDLTQKQKKSLHPYSALIPGIGPQGGEVNHEMNSFLKECQASVVPMSRGLTGIGDAKQKSNLQTVTSWDGYQTYIQERISVAARQITC